MANYEMDRLPILDYAREIREAIRQNPSVIVTGETGSGKTTQIPLMLLNTFPHSKIAVTEPRRIAATSVARFVAQQRRSLLGDEVGYQVRFDDLTTTGTRANFYTDGIVVRKVQTDPILLEFDALMVDEAHERNLPTDFLLGLAKDIQRKRNYGQRNLKVVVASATLEEDKFSIFFDNAPIIRIPRRQYPITIHYETPQGDYTEAAANRARTIINEEGEGNILIFMPGYEEIRKTIRILEGSNLDATILPLHGQLTLEQQDRIFQPSRNRKIVVATNIAETSVTIPDTKFVIDSGLIRHTEFNPRTGIETLVTVPHAQSGCIQRAGRAGRTSAGEVFRLYTEDDFNRRPLSQKPEIQRVNLGHVMLQMKKLGISDIQEFEFIDPPDKEHLQSAVETLQNLGALDRKENLTQTGSVMAEFPLEPHASRTVVEAIKLECTDEACTIMAFNGLRSVFLNQSEGIRQFISPGSDFLTLLNVWAQFAIQGRNEQWAESNFLNFNTLVEAAKVRDQLLGILRRFGVEQTTLGVDGAVVRAIVAGHIDNLLIRMGRETYRSPKAQNVNILLHPSSVLSHSKPDLVVATEIVQTSNVFARGCQEVDPAWIAEVAPHLARFMRFYSKSGEVMGRLAIQMKGSDRPFPLVERPTYGPEATKTFAHAMAQRMVPLPEDLVRHNKEVVAQIRELWIRSGGKVPPRFDPGAAFNDKGVEEIFAERIGPIRSRAELDLALQEDRVNLRLRVEDYLPEDLQKQIISDNPDTITLGNWEYPIEYRRSKFQAIIPVDADQLSSLPDRLILPNGREIDVMLTVGDKHLLGSPLEVREKLAQL